jgi:hypothetical protein
MNYKGLKFLIHTASTFLLATPGFKILKIWERKLTFHLGKYDTDSFHMALICKANANSQSIRMKNESLNQD